MKTLKTLHAESIIKECDSILLKLLCDISDLKKATVNGKIRPCKARKMYKSIILRATFYNHISYNVCEKYELTRTKDIQDFSEYMVFFEC